MLCNGLGLWQSYVSGLPTCLVLIPGFPTALILPHFASVSQLFFPVASSVDYGVRTRRGYWALSLLPLSRCYVLRLPSVFSKAKTISRATVFVPSIHLVPHIVIAPQAQAFPRLLYKTKSVMVARTGSLFLFLVPLSFQPQNSILGLQKHEDSLTSKDGPGPYIQGCEPHLF